MFSENYSSSAVGAYKITNLSCSIDSTEINNQQTYGFSVTVPGRLVKVNSENISFNWQVLDPRTNAQANLNDGIFTIKQWDIVNLCEEKQLCLENVNNKQCHKEATFFKNTDCYC